MPLGDAEGECNAAAGFPDLTCSVEDAETIAALSGESEALGRLNTRIIQHGGKPIPPRAARR
jgi:hypothetical protein